MANPDDFTCPQCRLSIPAGALICSKCGSFQDRRRYFMWAMPVLSLALGLALGIPTIYDIWKLMFHTPRSHISVVSLDIQDTGVLVDTINLGDNPGVIGKQFSCDENYEGEGRLSLTVVGQKAIVVFPMKEAEQTWDIWNVYVAGAALGKLTTQEIELEAERLIEDFPNQGPAQNEQEILVKGLSGAPYAPMYDAFRYYLVLAGYLNLFSERKLPDEFDFSCQLDVTDGTKDPYRESFSLSFGNGNYGINPKRDPSVNAGP